MIWEGDYSGVSHLISPETCQKHISDEQRRVVTESVKYPFWISRFGFPLSARVTLFTARRAYLGNMNTQNLYLYPLLFGLSQAALAHDNFLTINDQIGCSGYLRAGYLHSSIGSPKNLSASAVAGELGCHYQVNDQIKIQLGAFGSTGVGLNSDDESRIHGDFYNADLDGYLMLGEAFVTLSFDQLEANLGRQRLDTPHMDSDDLRMVPNLFEAYLVNYQLTEQVAVGVGFVRTMAGWENGGNQSHSIGIGDSLGGDGDRSWVSWASYEDDAISGSFWYYRVPDHLQIIYGELTYAGRVNDAISYEFAIQYDWGDELGEAKLGDVNAKTWGLSSSLSGYGLTASTAINQNSGDGALGSLGGGAFFTSMEDQTLDAVFGKDAEAWAVALEYEAMESLTVGTAWGQFSASNSHDYDVEEMDLYLSYAWSEATVFDLIYAEVDDNNGGDTAHQIRTIFSYSY